MPVVTRLQSKLMAIKSAEMFIKTIEDPCILQGILDKLNKQDVVNLKLVSNDIRFNDTIDLKLEKLLEEKKKDDEVIDNVKCYLETVEKTIGEDKKADLVIELYEYLSNNKWFIEKHNAFYKSVYNKAFQLMKEHYETKKLIQCLVTYLVKVCNLKPPTDYYDSQTSKLRHGLFDKKGQFIDVLKF